MKKTLLLTVFGLLTCILNAQIVTDERPYGLNVKAVYHPALADVYNTSTAKI
jgi:hypothetical protein